MIKVTPELDFQVFEWLIFGSEFLLILDKQVERPEFTMRVGYVLLADPGMLDKQSLKSKV